MFFRLSPAFIFGLPVVSGLHFWSSGCLRPSFLSKFDVRKRPPLSGANFYEKVNIFTIKLSRQRFGLNFPENLLWPSFLLFRLSLAFIFGLPPVSGLHFWSSGCLWPSFLVFRLSPAFILSKFDVRKHPPFPQQIFTRK